MTAPLRTLDGLLTARSTAVDVGIWLVVGMAFLGGGVVRSPWRPASRPFDVRSIYVCVGVLVPGYLLVWIRGNDLTVRDLCRGVIGIALWRRR